MTELLLAKTAGFCFGVNRAVKMAYDLAETGQKIATLGPIIHNPQVVEDLQRKGVSIIERPEEVPEDTKVIIRSHGVERHVYDTLEARGIAYADATCPFVAKIQRIVRQKSEEGYVVIIAGDRHHPEVLGIVAHAVGEYYVVKDEEELVNCLEQLKKEGKERVILAAQTTFHTKIWKKCTEIAKKDYTNLIFFDTICSATNERQTEAIKLAKECDRMVVIGGRSSSNTKKLWQVCSLYAPTDLIETAEELSALSFDGCAKVGITAGASTPADIIKEVLKTMNEMLNKTQESSEFAAMLEQSLETEKLYSGKRVKGIVTTIAPNEIHVDIGAKQTGIVSADELVETSDQKPADVVKKGDEIELIVLKVNDQEGIVTLSKKRCDALAGFDTLKKAYEEGTILEGVITNVVKGGALVLSNHTKVFVPASQISNKRIEDLNSVVKQEVKFKILEINERRGRALGSIRAVAAEERRAAEEKFWSGIEVGKTYTGEVKSITSYGAFVDLGGVDGMIHITELSWTKVKHPSEVVSVGDTVEVYVKDVDQEKRRISLGYKKDAENPWVVFETNYNVGDVVSVKIVSFTNYGAFASIIPGIDGLIHISQIANQRVDKIAELLEIGQEVEAKIIDINHDAKRVSLSIRALLADEAAEEAAE